MDEVSIAPGCIIAIVAEYDLPRRGMPTGTFNVPPLWVATTLVTTAQNVTNAFILLLEHVCPCMDHFDLTAGHARPVRHNPCHG